MAGANNAGCGGLVVVGLIFFGLISQCGKGEVASDTSSRASTLYASGSGDGFSPDSSHPTHRYVRANSLNCRSAPGTTASVVARLSDRAYVGVIRQENGWSLLQSPNCWVSSGYLGVSPRAAAPQRSYPSSTARRNYSGGSCPCSGGNVCIGPRGGRYCITSGGNKRYGV